MFLTKWIHILTNFLKGKLFGSGPTLGSVTLTARSGATRIARLRKCCLGCTGRRAPPVPAAAAVPCRTDGLRIPAGRRQRSRHSLGCLQTPANTAGRNVNGFQSRFRNRRGSLTTFCGKNRNGILVSETGFCFRNRNGFLFQIQGFLFADFGRHLRHHFILFFRVISNAGRPLARAGTAYTRRREGTARPSRRMPSSGRSQPSRRRRSTGGPAGGARMREARRGRGRRRSTRDKARSGLGPWGQ